MTEPTITPASVRPRKRARRILLIVVVVGLIGLALVPGLATPLILERVVADFDRQHAGSLRIDSASVGWFSETRVEGASLLDPDGQEVAQLELRAPSLFELAVGLGRDLGTIHVSARAALVADEEGVTNLTRALTPSAKTANEREGSDDKPDAKQGSPSRIPRARIEIEITEVTWSDPTTRASGFPIGLNDLRGNVVIDTEKRSLFELTGTVLGRQPGRLACSGVIERPMAALDGNDPPNFHIDVDVEGLAVGLLDAVAGAQGDLVALVGPLATVNLQGSGTPQAGALDARIQGDGIDLVASLELKDGVLRERSGGAALELELSSLDVVFATLAPRLPEGASLAPTAPEARLRLKLPQLHVPLSALTAQDGPAAHLGELGLACELSLPDLTFVPPARDGKAVGTAIPLASLQLDARFDPGAPLEGRLRASLGGPWTCDFAVDRPLAELDGPNPPVVHIEADLNRIPAGLLDELAGAEGALLDLVGPELSLRLDAVGHPRNATLEAKLEGRDIDLETQLELADGVLTGREGTRVLQLELRSLSGLFARVTPFVPEGADLVLTEKAPRAELRIATLHAPLSALQAEDGLAAHLAEFGADLELSLPALTYAQPSPKPDAPATPVPFNAVRIAAQLVPGSPATGTLRGEVGASAPGRFEFAFAHPDLAQALATPPPGVRLDGTLSGVPTALIDALAAQDGLLVDVLGPALEGELHGTWPEDAEPLRARFSSNSGRFEVAAHLTDGVLRADTDGAMTAEVGLTPLFSKRIVGNLVPHLVGLAKNDPAERVALRLSNFALPLDGDLSKVSGALVLDLGTVQYRVLPGLEQVLKLAGGGAETLTQSFQPLSMQIQDGLVRHERLPLRIDGKEYPFSGSFNLATRAFDLDTQLPLALLGKSVLADLGKATSALKADTLVPVELRGTWSKPRLGIGKTFVEDALKKVGNDLLQRGIRDLFGGK